MTLRADTEATSQKGVPTGLVRNAAVFLSDMLNVKFLIGSAEGETLELGFAYLDLQKLRMLTLLQSGGLNQPLPIGSMCLCNLVMITL